MPSIPEPDISPKLVSVVKCIADSIKETNERYTLWSMKAEISRTMRHFSDLESLVAALLMPKRG